MTDSQVKKYMPLTERQRKFLDKALVINTDEPEEIGFIMRALVQASMPHSKVHGMAYKRKNNNYTLSILGNEEAGGIPYGTYPRLILSWLASEVVKTRQREIILGKSLSSFMHNLGLSVTGGRWGTVSRFKDQMKKLFASVITCSFEDEKSGQWVNKTITIADKAEIFWDPNHPDQIDLFKSTITLGEQFYTEILEKPIPVDIRAINALKESSLALDIYFWLTYRMSYLNRVTPIPYEKLHLQFGSGYADTKYGRYEFKRKFLKQLEKVSIVYPQAKVTQTDEGLVMYPSPSHIQKKPKLI